MSEALIGLVGALVGAVIGGAASFVTSWQSRSWSAKEWLLNARREGYLELLSAVKLMNDAVRAKFGDQPGPWLDPEGEIRSDLVPALLRARLVASKPVSLALTSLLITELNAYAKNPTKATALALDSKLEEINALMRTDLRADDQ